MTRARRLREGGGPAPAAPVVERALQAPSRAIEPGTRAGLEARLGHDLGQVRVHEGSAADEAAHALGARAFALGRDVVLGAAAARGPARRATLAHEAAHAVQQGMARDGAGGMVRHPSAEREAQRAADGATQHASAAITARIAPAVQADLEDPGRLGEVHDTLFVAAPGGGGTRQPWEDATAATPGTAATIIAQAKRAVRDLVRTNPASVGGTTPVRTTETALDTDALSIDARVRARFPLIAAPASPDAITDAVSVMGPTLTSGQDYLREWLANRLITWTDIERFEIAETDARFVAMLDALLADADVGAHLRTLATRVAGFNRGEGGNREVFIHSAATETARRLVLIHELVHFHAHPRFTEWIETTTDPRFFKEGFTEWLAQRVMTDDERAGRGSYEDRVRAIERDVAANVPEDDIARAYFAGEVWRIESRSTIARREFAAASGIAEGAAERAEGAASRAGPGIAQEVARGVHYRFLNLGHDAVEPKAEHVAYFREVKVRHIDTASDVQVRFVGHASTPGSPEHNRYLSRRRALAFYRMARREGLPDARLADAAQPEHHGESRPTLTEQDAQTRAFNRRVEMFLRTPDAADAPARDEDAER
jgi:hypothetical protein